MLEQPIVTFSTATEFRRWLGENHVDHPGIWLKLAKKKSGLASINYAEAIDEAICFGWIDGQSKKFDDREWLQKFTRRGPRSVWSAINIGHVERLTREGRMQPAGLAAVTAAQADGGWEAAYQSTRTAQMPEDFLRALEQNEQARSFFESLNKTERYSFYFRITTARTANTRARRIQTLIAKLTLGDQSS